MRWIPAHILRVIEPWRILLVRVLLATGAEASVVSRASREHLHVLQSMLRVQVVRVIQARVDLGGAVFLARQPQHIHHVHVLIVKSGVAVKDVVLGCELVDAGRVEARDIPKVTRLELIAVALLVTLVTFLVLLFLLLFVLLG